TTTAQLTILDAAGRTVRVLGGTARPGVNRVVWNLTEASACPGAPIGRGRGGANASWIRALPGDYSVRLTTAGASSQQPLAVRLDPRVSVTAEDLQVYAREVRIIEGVECSASQGLSRIQRIDAQLRRIDAGANPTSRDPAATVP